MKPRNAICAIGAPIVTLVEYAVAVITLFALFNCWFSEPLGWLLQQTIRFVGIAAFPWVCVGATLYTLVWFSFLNYHKCKRFWGGDAK